jgi:hypothetical protein
MSRFVGSARSPNLCSLTYFNHPIVIPVTCRAERCGISVWLRVLTWAFALSADFLRVRDFAEKFDKLHNIN